MCFPKGKGGDRMKGIRDEILEYCTIDPRERTEG